VPPTIPTPEDVTAWLDAGAVRDVDGYGVPREAFGHGTPPEFFEILGRLLAVNGKIEYLKDRLDHLPGSEIIGIRKVEQFVDRYKAGRLERNSIVHSHWVFDADIKDPEVILGIRYRSSKNYSGEIATVSIGDVPESERETVVVRYRLDELRKLLKRDVTTMGIGERAFTESNLRWAAKQLASDGSN
jgi:hypothetical protein